MWIHLKWRQSWEGVETNLHKYSAPCFQHLKKFDFTQLMLGAAKRLIVWSPWPPCLTQSVWSHWSIIRRIFVVHFSIVILVFHDFDGMGCLKFPVWYFHAHYLSEDWRVSISMQISELVALSYPLRHCQRSCTPDHPPFTNLQLNGSTQPCSSVFANLVFAICRLTKSSQLYLSEVCLNWHMNLNVCQSQNIQTRLLSLGAVHILRNIIWGSPPPGM